MRLIIQVCVPLLLLAATLIPLSGEKNWQKQNLMGHNLHSLGGAITDADPGLVFNYKSTP